MITITPQSIADLGRFLYQHTDCSEKSARSIIRAASAGQPISLPNALDLGGEVLRGQLATIFKLIPSVAGDAIAAPPLVASGASTPAPAEAKNPAPAMSFESRRIAFRAIAGPRLEAMADALAATSVSLDEGTRAIQTARANLPPEGRRTPTIAERAAGQEEFGGSYEPPSTPKGRAADGWKRAIAAAQAGG